MLKRVIFPSIIILAIVLILLIFSGVGMAKSKSKAMLKSEKIPKINISLPVTMSKCAPCHDTLDRQYYKTVRIPHYLHFKKGVPCQACHNTNLPHDKGTLNKPLMRACFNCHGLNHGPKGLMAPTKCSVCHPADFNLVPKNHTAEWKAFGHKNEDAQSKRQCALCHQGKRNTCNTCHKDVKNLPMTLRKKIKPKIKTSLKHYAVDKAGPVSISKCNPCHNNWDRVEYEKVRFYHQKHFARGVKCFFCHESFPHRRGYIVKPKMKQCFTCHSTEHGPGGDQLAPGNCLTCHRVKFKQLRPDFHTTAFMGGGHKTLAKKERSLCGECHRQSFCDNCHQLSKDSIPHPLGWRTKHGTVAVAKSAGATKDTFACFNCHKPQGPQHAYQKAPSCAKCHKAVVFPHPQPWAPKHGKTAEKVGKTVCYTCHKNKTFCNSCHNGITMPHNRNTWIGQHRLFLRDNPISKCLGCHIKSQCLLCHKTHKVHKSHEIYDFRELKR